MKIGRRFKRIRKRFLTMLGPDLNAIGGNEFEPRHADESEHTAQIALEMFERGRRCARAVKSRYYGANATRILTDLPPSLQRKRRDAHASPQTNPRPLQATGHQYT